MNKIIKKESENEIQSIEEENKIIEEIIKNKLLINDIDLNKDYEDLEEDENEDDILEKDKITEEILNNKLSFIVPDENEKLQDEINKNQRRVHKDIIEDLLIELFNYHYNGITGQKRKSPQARMFATKYHIEFFYTKLNIDFINFSKYILLILEQKIEELMEYIKNNIYKKKMTVRDVLDIKKSLCLVGINLVKIFERPFEKTRNFDISSVLEVLLISDILNDNDIDINDQEYEEIINIPKLDEKDNFEKYIEECKTYFEKIQNGEREEEDVEVEEEKIIEDDDDDKNEEKGIDEDINKTKGMYWVDEEIKTNDIDENEKKKDNKSKSIKRNKDICENNIKIKNENSNEKNNINKIKKENDEKNNSDKDVNDKSIMERNEYLTVDDLLKYINGSDDKKKKKKKRKKKKKVEENKNDNKKTEEKDDIIESFKSYIINFSANLEKNQKIKPNISQSFLDKL